MTEIKRKKVLMITYAFPPVGGSAVQRPLKFSKFLPEFGWDVHVLTPKRKMEPLDPSLVNEIPKNVRVTEVFSMDPAGLDLMIKEKFTAGGANVVYNILRAILKLYSMVYYRTIKVDWCEGWVRFGVEAGQRIVKDENIDLIYAHGQPPSTLLVGYRLKRITAKPLVIDYDDSWTTSVEARKAEGMRMDALRRLEEDILRAADKAVSVKKETVKELKAAFPAISEDKFVFLPNGYDPADFHDIQRKRADKFTIAYTGTLTGKFCYSPESFLGALGQLVSEGKIPEDKVEVVFAGRVSPSYVKRLTGVIDEAGLKKTVKFTGFVDHRKSLEYLMSADLLLVMIESLRGKEASMEYSGIIPAKIFEYIALGVPILGIVPPGFESDLIKRTRTGYTAEPNNVLSVKEALYDLYKKRLKGELLLDPDWEEIKRYDRKAITGTLADIFNRTVSGKR